MTLFDELAYPPEKRIETSRLFSFSSDKIFQAIQTPELLAKWWGPTGFTNTFEKFEFVEGGIWKFTMHSPDGKDFANLSRFTKIVENRLVELDHLCAPLFHLIIELEPQVENCLLSFVMLFDDTQVCAAVRQYAPAANEQNLDRLTAVLRGSF